MLSNNDAHGRAVEAAAGPGSSVWVKARSAVMDDCTFDSSGAPERVEDTCTDICVEAATLEGLPTEPLYNILLFLDKQDVAHVKMCSRRLMCNILRACQHWAPKVESWLASDPSSAGLLQQLRDVGGRQLQPPAEEGPPSSRPLSLDLATSDEDSSSLAEPLTKQQHAAGVLSEVQGDLCGITDTIRAVHGSTDTQLAAGEVDKAASDSSSPVSSLTRAPSDFTER